MLKRSIPILAGLALIFVLISASVSAQELGLTDERCLWTYSTESMPKDLAVISDIDGDGVDEIVIGERNGALSVLNGKTAKLIWKATIPRAIAVITSYTHDLKDYVLVRSAGPSRLTLLETHNGEQLWDTLISGNSGWARLATTIIPDINGDGWSDICIGSDDEIACFSGLTGAKVWTNTLSQARVFESIWITSTEEESPIIGIGTSINGVFLLDGSNGEVIRSRQDIWAKRIESHAIAESNLFIRAGIPNNNQIEKVVALSPIDLGIKWEVELSRFWDFLAVPDINADYLGDLIVGIWEDKGPVCAMNAVDGSILWECDLYLGGNPEPFDASGDFNNDGFPELLVGTGGGPGFVYLIDLKAGSVLWTFHASEEVQSDISELIVAGDLNGDGIPDVVAASWDLNIYALSGKISKNN
ncbi:FG-GAP-like repeat-containing protein [Gemmatimonadota bacterium]